MRSSELRRNSNSRGVCAEGESSVVELEDKGADERTVEPDFFVDRPPTPEFIPNPSGLNQETQTEDHELFDYELEVEPILEVLVGKALEAGRIEAVEDWERSELQKHKLGYDRVREAELMEVQRLESAYNRRVEETQRRKLQQEAKTQLKVQTQQKLLARLISRAAMFPLKGASLQLLEGAGVLRDPKEQDMHAAYVPHLLGVVEEQLMERSKEKPILMGIEAKMIGVDMLGEMVDALAMEHRAGIEKEYKRRFAKREKEEERQQNALEGCHKRREERAKRREDKRLEELKAKLDDQIVSKGTPAEDASMAKISDVLVGDADKHIFAVGGLLGEMILTFSKLIEYQTMNNPEFKLTPEMLETALQGVIEAFAKSEALIEIPFDKEHNFVDLVASPDPKALQDALATEGIATPGLKYMLEKLQKFGVNAELATQLVTAAVKLKFRKLAEPLVPVPELPQPTEEQLKDLPEEKKAEEKDRVAKENEEIRAKNAEIKKHNEDVDKTNAELTLLQGKIKITGKVELPDKGQICAIARMGPIAAPPTPKAGMARPNETVDPSLTKRGQKSQPVLVVPRYLTIASALSDDLRAIVVHKGN